jgi:O-antigen ligase
MEHADTAQLAAVAGALGSILVLLARGRLVLLAGLLVLGAAELGLALALESGALDKLTTGAGAAAGALGVLLVCALAAVLVRWPALVPLVVLIAAPFRPPLDFSTSNRFLVSVAEGGQLGRLLPLYFVLAAAVLALAWRALRGDEMRALPPVIAMPAAAFFAFAFLSLTWAQDVEAGTNLLVFFTLPFVALLATVARAPFPDWLPRGLGIAAVSLATLFAAVGLWQAATHDLFFYAPNLAVSNANTDYFRVTSLFGDPSLYGRHVVLGICVVLALLVTGKGNRWLLIVVLAVLWAGLFFSYSQSSMVALVVTTVALAAVTGDRRVRRAVAVLGALAVLAGIGFVVAELVSGEDLNHITSDRTDRVEQTLRVVRHDPLVGVGIGGQPRASRELAHSQRPTPNFVSHTTPLTVAAELGLIGFALYTWLLVGGALLLLSVYRRDGALALALASVFLALFVHALFYSGFLEDPLTWVVLAVAAGWLTSPAGVARAPRRSRRPAESRAATVAP